MDRIAAMIILLGGLVVSVLSIVHPSRFRYTFISYESNESWIQYIHAYRA
jgi:hypothetical protein